MKKLMFNLITLTLGIVLMCSTARAGEFFFDTVIDQTISTSTAGKTLNLQGYEDFALQARFDGGVANANKTFAFEVYNNNQSVARETVTLTGAGWANFSKVYTVYSPTVMVTVYNPPANLKTKITVYAAH